MDNDKMSISHTERMILLKIRLLSLLLALALLLCACASDDDYRRRNDDDDDDERIEDREDDDDRDDHDWNFGGDRDEDDRDEDEPTVQENIVTGVHFSYMTSEDFTEEFAKIAGTDDSGREVWVHYTETYPMAQLVQVSAVGRWRNIYYYVEGGSLVALDTETGEPLWINDDFGGCPANDQACLITQDGTVLLTGYFGPDFMVIDRHGNTLNRTETFDSDYYLPYFIEMTEDLVQISFEGTPDGDGIHLVNIDPNTWEEFE